MPDEPVLWELVGGPRDGDRVAIPPGHDRLNIVRAPDPSRWIMEEPAPATAALPLGQYRRHLGVFEWQGWADDPPKETPPCAT